MATEPATTDQAFRGPAAFEEESRREGVHGTLVRHPGTQRRCDSSPQEERRSRVISSNSSNRENQSCGCGGKSLWRSREQTRVLRDWRR